MLCSLDDTVGVMCFLMGMEAGKEGKRSTHLAPALNIFSFLILSTKRWASHLQPKNPEPSRGRVKNVPKDSKYSLHLSITLPLPVIYPGAQNPKMTHKYKGVKLASSHPAGRNM